MQNQTNEENKIIIFNTPKNLDLTQLFPKFSKTYLDKVIYIIHQCNYYSTTGYNLSIDNHSWFFGLSANDTCAIIKILVDNHIIQLKSGCIANKKSAYYSIKKPFDIKNELEAVKHFYNLNDSKCPLHIQRYVADDYAVRNKITTKFKKVGKAEKANIYAQSARIMQLEDLLKANGITIPPIPELEPELNMCAAHINNVEANTAPAKQLSISKHMSTAPAKEKTLEPVQNEQDEITIDFYGCKFVIDSYINFKEAIADLSKDEINDIYGGVLESYTIPSGKSNEKFTVTVKDKEFQFYKNNKLGYKYINFENCRVLEA